MFKKCIGIFMAIIIVCCAITSGYNVNAEEDVFKNFTTNLTGLKVVNGTWTAAEEGIQGSNKGEGNTYVMSDVLINEGISFTYSGDISFSGAAAGIVFGVTDPANPSVKWYCMNAAPVEGGNGALCRLFLVENSSLVTDCNIQLENFDVTKVHTFKIDVLADEDSIEFYMDNEYVGVLSGTGYAGGYLGVITVLSDATFNNVKYTVVEETPVPSFSGWAAVSGIWNETSNGYEGLSQGRSLAKSGIIIGDNTSFVYEVHGIRTGYGFGVAFNIVDGDNFSAIEITDTQVTFPYRVAGAYATYFEGYVLTDAQKATSEFTLRIEYNATTEIAKIYLNGELIRTLENFDTDKLKGSMGLFTEDATVVCTKATYTVTDVAGNPQTIDNKFTLISGIILSIAAISVITTQKRYKEN